MPPQITRLTLLAVAIVVGYGIAHVALTPESFGKYGHYRANALFDIAAQEPVHAGKKACDECHSEVIAKLNKAPHKDLSCEGCHGASSAHVANPDLKITKRDDSLCLRCHETNSARPAWHKQITVKKHYTGQGACKECHMPHQPNEVP